MKFLKIAGFVLVGLIALFLLVAAVMPSDYRVERSIVIHAPVQDVFAKVVDFRQWPSWSPWLDMDRDAQVSMSGAPGEIGAVWRWDGDTVGVGNLTLVEFTTNTSIHSHLVFLEPFQMESEDLWQFESNGGETVVTWANEGELTYPFMRFLGPFLDGMMGKDYEKGLHRLKVMVENPPPPPPLDTGAPPPAEHNDAG
jgi:hypothetical protein